MMKKEWSLATTCSLCSRMFRMNGWMDFESDSFGLWHLYQHILKVRQTEEFIDYSYSHNVDLATIPGDWLYKQNSTT